MLSKLRSHAQSGCCGASAGFGLIPGSAQDTVAEEKQESRNRCRIELREWGEWRGQPGDTSLMVQQRDLTLKATGDCNKMGAWSLTDEQALVPLGCSGSWKEQLGDGGGCRSALRSGGHAAEPSGFY